MHQPQLSKQSSSASSSTNNLARTCSSTVTASSSKPVSSTTAFAALGNGGLVSLKDVMDSRKSLADLRKC